MVSDSERLGDGLLGRMLTLALDCRPVSYPRLVSNDSAGWDPEAEDVSGFSDDGAGEGLGYRSLRGARIGEFDAESLFSMDVRLTSPLSRCQEDTLARRLVRARKRVARIATNMRKAAAKAFPEPAEAWAEADDSFREGEVVATLNRAREALEQAGSRAAAAASHRRLRKVVAELSEALTKYRTLRDQMVIANLRLVILFARRHRHPRLSFLDFVQEGTLGLMRAVEKYEPDRNVKFSTYAVYWVWQQIARAADTQGALIRTPVHWNQVRRRLNRELWRAASEEGTVRSAQEWAAEQGLDFARLEAMTRPFQCISTDAPLSDEDDRPLEEQLAADSVAPEEHMIQSDLRRRLGALVDCLPGREAEIMRRRYGLSDTDSETLESVGERFGVSRERIRQIENRALKHLRALCTAEGLHEYLA